MGTPWRVYSTISRAMLLLSSQDMGFFEVPLAMPLCSGKGGTSVYFRGQGATVTGTGMRRCCRGLDGRHQADHSPWFGSAGDLIARRARLAFAILQRRWAFPWRRRQVTSSLCSRRACCTDGQASATSTDGRPSTDSKCVDELGIMRGNGRDGDQVDAALHTFPSGSPGGWRTVSPAFSQHVRHAFVLRAEIARASGRSTTSSLGSVCATFAVRRTAETSHAIPSHRPGSMYGRGMAPRMLSYTCHRQCSPFCIWISLHAVSATVGTKHCPTPHCPCYLVATRVRLLELYWM